MNGEYKDKFMLAVEADTRAIGNEPEDEDGLEQDETLDVCAECENVDECIKYGYCKLEREE